jgi:signal transduction histidine kinase
VKANRANRSHAAKVAAVATVIVMGCYVIGVVILNFVVVNRLTTEVDARLAQRLVDANQLTFPIDGATQTGSSGSDGRGFDIDDVPVFVWRVTTSGAVTALTTGAPTLPLRSWSSVPTTITIGPTQFRFRAVKRGSDWLVAGQSVAEIPRVEAILWVPELIFGVVLLVAVFGGALVIGLRASAPLEVVRRRQAEFTADASHELRTPLSVIEAEVDLALSRRRSAQTYEAVLKRVAGEGRRLRRIVDDLLWLARADGQHALIPFNASSDIAAVVAACTDRFQAVAETGEVSLSFTKVGEGPFAVQAPPDWIDRLTGVLVHNACKYAGTGGRVEVEVRAGAGNRVELQVDDTGPGISDEERPFIFDRFHRAKDSPGGTGLGLAIADSIVRSTQGAWSVGTSPLGGARMQVWWRRVPQRRITSMAPERQDSEGERPATMDSRENSHSEHDQGAVVQT